MTAKLITGPTYIKLAKLTPKQWDKKKKETQIADRHAAAKQRA